MKIKIQPDELKKILDERFRGEDNFYELEFVEGCFALEERIGHDRIRSMIEPPNPEKEAVRGIFPKMTVLTVVYKI